MSNKYALLNKMVLNSNGTEEYYYYNVNHRSIVMKVIGSVKEGCTPYVECEVTINNLRLLKFICDEYPKPDDLDKMIDMALEWELYKCPWLKTKGGR